MKDESAFKAASGLHGGIGGKGDVCGSLLGASMMFGLLCGCTREEADKIKRPEHPPKKMPPLKKDDPMYLTGELYKWFKDEFGSVKCRVIRKKHEKEVDSDISTRDLPKPQKRVRLFAKCDELTGKTAARTVVMLCDAKARD